MVAMVTKWHGAFRPVDITTTTTTTSLLTHAASVAGVKVLAPISPLKSISNQHGFLMPWFEGLLDYLWPKIMALINNLTKVFFTFSSSCAKKKHFRLKSFCSKSWIDQRGTSISHLEILALKINFQLNRKKSDWLGRNLAEGLAPKIDHNLDLKPH